MREARIATPYEAPELRVLGRLSVLTAFDGAGLHFAQAPVGSLGGGGGGGTPSGGTPPGSGSPVQGVQGITQSGGSPASVPDSGAVEGLNSPGPGSASAPVRVESGSATISAGGGGSLPFTGFAAGPLAALGAGLMAVGAALRRWTRRA